MTDGRNPHLRLPDRVELSTRCVHCGYELRGLASRQDCPECGRPVESTLLAGTLQAIEARQASDWRSGPGGCLRRLFIGLVVLAAVLLVVGILLAALR